MHGLLVLFRKELTDHLKSARFLLMLALLTLTSMASLTARWAVSVMPRRRAANLFF